MEIGNKLKFFRTKSKMTQSELAKGIISTSYLSKIEKEILEAPPQIVGLLCKKLDINPHLIEDDDLFRLSTNWFKVLLSGEIEESTKIFNEIVNNFDKIANTRLINLVEIHKLRHYMLTGNKKSAIEQFNYLEKVSNNFNDRENYYWFKISGIYKYSNLEFKKSLDSYLKAEKLLSKDIYFPKEEANNLFYVIAITASKLRKTHLSLVYAQKSLDYYQSVYNMMKCAQCHIILGISYRRIGELDKSKESYELGIIIANTINDVGILALCHQNLGKLYSLMKNSEEAINHFLRSYELRSNFPISKKIIPISSLMKEYYKKSDISSAQKWLERGIELIKSLTPSESIFFYEFQVYKQLIMGLDQSFEDLITSKVIPFLNEKQLFYEEYTYVRILADYYFNNRKYKKSASYYNYSNNILSKIYIE